MTGTQWVALAGFATAVIASLGGIVIGHRLAQATQREQAAERRKLHLEALRAEIEFCAKLART